MATTTKTKPTMTRTEEFKTVCDLSDIEQKLFAIRYRVLGLKVQRPDEIKRRLLGLKDQINEALENLQR
jgi:hypothetical protein